MTNFFAVTVSCYEKHSSFKKLSVKIKKKLVNMSENIWSFQNMAELLSM
jgi:hypothetical protein